MSKIITHDKVVERKRLIPVNYRALLPNHVDPRKITERRFPEGFPEGIMVPNLYIGYNAFEEIPKPEKYKAFFVFRDPRDITVSWYFSMKNSHPMMGSLKEIRSILKNKNKKDGLIWCIKKLEEKGMYSAIKEWVEKCEEKENQKVFKYKSLTGDRQVEVLKNLFEFLNVQISQKVIKEISTQLSFENRAKREKGDENKGSHLRKGKSGDWKNHFDHDIKKEFSKVAGTIDKYNVN